jgi:hypothetical protein
MAMSKRAGEQQEQFWIATEDMPQAPGHPFYRKLNDLLAEHEFERGCARGSIRNFRDAILIVR